ncbi:MAG: putative ABC transport system permease protein [Parcubacteria group bacterium Athens1014_10]|nr:MAG: putative ABC transport system permease protein [Parcubacteria group bacterium Athens1014_10]TSD05176.1 MAG: putative ABC transport system permease protein [Parcubacteria group bacterium Athens0714_12]
MFDQCKQCVKISVKALLANKGRSFLTMLGIIIGVGAVIIIMAVGAGAQSLILAQVKTLGANIIGVMPGKAEESGPPASIMGISITTLTYEDAMALRDKQNIPNIVEVAAYSTGVGTASWKSNTYDTNFRGSSAGYLKVEGGRIEQGRFFTGEEEKNLSKVAVLGSTVKEELFGESEAVGQRIKIKNHSFEVIGVMEERGTVAFQDFDDQIVLPLKTMQKLIAGVNHIGMLRAKVDSEENTEQAIRDVKIVLRERHNIIDTSGASDDFTVRAASQAINMITTVTDALRYFLVAMAALSLIVGGIGVMNIMLISVTERTREIGLRKAVGANNFNVMSQFLMEAVSVTLVGGLVGIILGALISYLVSVGAHFLGYEWDFIVSFFSIFLAVGVSMLIGLIFGLYPARKASGLDPIEALRYE